MRVAIPCLPKNEWPRRRWPRGGRATLVAAVGLVFVAFGATPSLPSVPSAKGMAFSVLSSGEPIGSHRVTFREEGEDLHVNVQIDLEFRMLFLTLFSYSHRNEEVWRDGRLQSLTSETDHNGSRFWVKARAEGDGLLVESSEGRFMAPTGIIPTSYWNPATIRQNQLLDSQHGRILNVDPVVGSEEKVVVAGDTVAAKRVDLTGDLELSLWYSRDGEWVKTAFAFGGVEVEYQRVASEQTAAK